MIASHAEKSRAGVWLEQKEEAKPDTGKEAEKRESRPGLTLERRRLQQTEQGAFEVEPEQQPEGAVGNDSLKKPVDELHNQLRQMWEESCETLLPEQLLKNEPSACQKENVFERLGWCSSAWL